MAADDHAIVVGISHYPGIGDLSGPENDARAFVEWLCSASGGNVPRENIDRILSSDFPWSQDPVNSEPTAQAVERAINKLYVIGDSKGDVGRRLYLFMAGHGLSHGLRDAALLMANAAKGRMGHSMPAPLYADWFRESEFFQEVVLFMDCCLRVDKISPPQPCHLDPVSASRPPARYYHALAADFSQSAHELPDESGEIHGVFSSSILAALWQGPPGGGDVTGVWLEDFVPQYMTKLLGSKDLQIPRFDFQRNADIVFVKRTAASYRVRIHTNLAGQSQKVEMCDGTLTMVQPTGRTNETWEWELGPGIYRYGRSGGPRHFLELMGDEREIDVQL